MNDNNAHKQSLVSRSGPGAFALGHLQFLHGTTSGRYSVYTDGLFPHGCAYRDLSPKNVLNMTGFIR